MEGEMSKGMDLLVQVCNIANESSLKLGVVQARSSKLKVYPEAAFDKYRGTLTKMVEMLTTIGNQANAIWDKLWLIYAEDLKDRYPDIDFASGAKKPRLLPDAAITKLPRPKKQPKKRMKDVTMDDLFDD